MTWKTENSQLMENAENNLETVNKLMLVAASHI